MAESAAEKRARLAELEAGDEQPKRRLSKAESELREQALRGDLPLPGVEHRPHLELHERFHRQWPPSESRAVEHESHSEVHEHLARKWPTAHRESNSNG